MTRLFVVMEGMTPSSVRIHKTVVAFDAPPERSTGEEPVTVVSLDAVDDRYGPDGKTATLTKTGVLIDTFY